MQTEKTWQTTLLAWIHKGLLLAALVVTVPTTFWFLEKHVGSTWWYPYIGVLFVDGGLLLWYYSLDHWARNHEQRIIAAIMMGVSALGVATAFLLQILNIQVEPLVVEIIIPFVILANIGALLAFGFFNPEAILRRTQHAWHWRQQQVEREGEREREARRRAAANASAANQEEATLIALETKIADEQRLLDAMKAERDAIQHGLSTLSTLPPRVLTPTAQVANNGGQPVDGNKPTSPH